MKAIIIVVLISIASLVYAGDDVPRGEWVVVNLSQIELTPTEGWFVGEGLYFANGGSYDTQFSCPKDRFISITDSKLIDRTLSMALYAKSTDKKIKIYVAGCDSRGVLIGLSSMMID